MHRITALDVAQMQAALSRWIDEDMAHGVFVTDRDFRVVVWNRWLERYSGRTASETLGRSVFDVCPDLVERGMNEYYENALAGQITIISHGLHRYLVALPPTHPILPFEEMPQSGHITPLMRDSGVAGTVTMIEDVSDRLVSEAHLRAQVDAQHRARATAETALRAKDDFLSTLSHEIRTPLNAVLGWARILLARKALDAQLLDRALHVIERNASAQAKIIDDMLDVARIVSGKLRLEMQPVDMATVISAALDVVMPAATAKRIAVQSTLASGTPPVLGDPDRLQQVVWNLLSNAIKFTDSGGAIEVRLDVEDGRVRVIVSDSGQGISKDFLPHVFERFRQNDASSSRRHGGLGLGLALVRELVDLHGGTVRATSEGPHKGASFILELPAAATDGQPVAPAPDTDREAARLDDVVALVVDDEPDSRELLARVLEQAGARVAAVGSTAEAMRHLTEASHDSLPDVLISDIEMPREDGYQLIRRVRSTGLGSGKRIPAITVSGYATAAELGRAFAAGYDVHVAKPIDPAALVRAIGDLLRRRTQ